jgi:hypothetical protein
MIGVDSLLSLSSISDYGREIVYDLHSTVSKS